MIQARIGPCRSIAGRTVGAHDGQQSLVGPLGLGHEVVQRLVGRLHPTGINPRRHGLDALALARQDQPGAVGFERRHTIGMAECSGQTLDIARKAHLTRLHVSPVIHPRLRESESPRLHPCESS